QTGLAPDPGDWSRNVTAKRYGMQRGFCDTGLNVLPWRAAYPLFGTPADVRKTRASLDATRKTLCSARLAGAKRSSFAACRWSRCFLGAQPPYVDGPKRLPSTSLLLH